MCLPRFLGLPDEHALIITHSTSTISMRPHRLNRLPHRRARWHVAAAARCDGDVLWCHAWWQVFSGFAIFFPLNLVLMPLSALEWFLRYQITFGGSTP